MNQKTQDALYCATTFFEMAAVLNISEEAVNQLHTDWTNSPDPRGYSAEHFVEWIIERDSATSESEHRHALDYAALIEKEVKADIDETKIDSGFEPVYWPSDQPSF